MAGEPWAEQSGGLDKGRWPVRLCLPGNDFWLFDEKLIRFSYFSGGGHILQDEMVSDRAVARMCSVAFEAIWERAIPHAEYRLT
jgi:hypothetical protein